MIKCDIKFKQTSQSVVYSGSVVIGEAVITLEKPLNVRGIALIFDGIAHVEWGEDEYEETTNHITFGNASSDNEVFTVETYKADEKYIYTVNYLIGSSKGGGITLDAGIHTYTFSCLLPPELPSSIECKYGHVRYTAKVIFDLPWKFDKTFEVRLTVLNLTDLNKEDPQIKLPLTLKVQKNFLCWFFSIKSLIVEASTPQTAYFSGQSLPLTINLYNESRANINRIDVTLEQIIKCTSHSPSTKTKLETTSVAKIVLDSIENDPKQSLHVDLFIPVVPSTTSKLICRFIQINYELRIKTIISGPYTSPIITIPIFIGNTPLKNIKNQAFHTKN